MLQALPLVRFRAERAGPRRAAKRERAWRQFVAAVQGYLDMACRPILELPSHEAPSLAQHIRRRAVAMFDTRVGVLQALAELVEADPDAAETLEESADEASDASVQDPRLGLSAAATAAFRQGCERTAVAIEQVVTAAARAPEALSRTPEIAEQLSLLCPWIDVAQSIVWWYLRAREPWMQHAVVEAACVLVREWGLEYASLVESLLAAPKIPSAGNGSGPDAVTADRDAARRSVFELNRRALRRWLADNPF